MHIETLAVHGGYTPDPTTKSAAVPLYQTVAYAFDNAQHGADLFDLKVAGNIYTRIMNPTQAVVEAQQQQAQVMPAVQSQGWQQGWQQPPPVQVVHSRQVVPVPVPVLNPSRIPVLNEEAETL